MDSDKILKVIAILSAFTFLILFTTLPKTDCQVCELEYNGDFIDGYDAFDIYEDACLSYAKPWETPDPVNIKLNETFKYSNR